MTDATSADKPLTGDGRQYHLHTRPGDLAERCLLVGDPDRATMIAITYFQDPKKVGDHRGLLSYTGSFDGIPVSVITTGMGGPSAGIVMNEAVASGARMFIRVGSCGALVKDMRPGDLMIASAAARYDGSGENWAPIEWPAIADWKIVSALVDAARCDNANFRVAVGITTGCFREGQGREAEDGWLAPRLRERHEEMLRLGAGFYSMEDAAIFVWCAAHGGYPVGAINAVYANRLTGEMEPKGDELAARVALTAITRLR